MAAALLPIGELARRTGLATSALRYYEKVGLLAPARRSGGQRWYRAASVERVASIRLFQDAGFTLPEIRVLLADGGRRGRSWKQVVETKLEELDARIARAEHARGLVRHALACRHTNLFACDAFRAALRARLGASDLA